MASKDWSDKIHWQAKVICRYALKGSYDDAVAKVEMALLMLKAMPKQSASDLNSQQFEKILNRNVVGVADALRSELKRELRPLREALQEVLKK